VGRICSTYNRRSVLLHDIDGHSLHRLPESDHFRLPSRGRGCTNVRPYGHGMMRFFAQTGGFRSQLAPVSAEVFHPPSRVDGCITSGDVERDVLMLTPTAIDPANGPVAPSRSDPTYQARRSAYNLTDAPRSAQREQGYIALWVSPCWKTGSLESLALRPLAA
jgi:hypothetical protein